MKTIKDAYEFINDKADLPSDDNACLYFDDTANRYLWINHRSIYCDYQYICTAKQLRDYIGNNTMIKFDLERALAGDKVFNGCGEEISELTRFFSADEGNCEYAGVRGGRIYIHGEDDLFMAPKNLIGFANLNRYGSGLAIVAGTFATKAIADLNAGNKRIACIDLSQFEEGHGL